MKKLLIGASVVVVLAGLVVYPSIRAPKAQTIVAEQLAQLQEVFDARDIGSFEVIEHQTDRDAAHLEIHWRFNLAQSTDKKTIANTSLTNGLKTITAISLIDINFGLLPTTKGFSSMTSTTTSAEVDEILAQQGHADGLTFSCTTVPASPGHESECVTNQLTLQNTDSKAQNQDIQDISIAPSELNFNINHSDAVLAAQWSLPSFKLNGQDKTLALVENTQLEINTPFDPSGTKSLIDTLIGRQVLDGDSISKLLIERVEVHSPSADKPIIMAQLTANADTTTKDGISKGQASLQVESLEGLPVDISSFVYDIEIENVDSQAMSLLSKMFDQSDLNPSNTAPNPQPFDQEEAKTLFANILAKGPMIAFNLKLAQSTGDTLSIESRSQFEATDQDTMRSAIDPIISGNAGDTVAIMSFLLDNIALEINATADETMVKNIAALASSARPGMGQAPPAQQDQAAMQNIAMLEMLGILAKNEKSYSTKLSVNDQGILLNGKDISPMLGLPPKATTKQ